MNLLYTVRSFPKLSESFVLNEIYKLDRKGHNVAVFAQKKPDEKIQHSEFTKLDVPVYYAGTPSLGDVPELFSSNLLNRSVLSRCMYTTHPKYHAWFLYLAKHCIEFIESLEFDVDIIHGHFATQDKIAMSYVGSYFDIPYTVTAHAREIFTDPNTKMLNLLFERCCRVITPSEYNREFLTKSFVASTPIDVVPATTPVSKFKPTPTEKPNRLLTIGRLVEKKGMKYAIDAVAELQETFPDVEFHVIGTGELKANLQDRVAEHGIESNVQFLGNVTDKRLIEELNQASVFTLPCVVGEDGDRDVMPVVLKEAMAMKTPCVSTTVSAVPELIDDGVDGILVEPRNPNELADAIRHLLSDDEFRTQMGSRARYKIESKFSLDSVVEQLLESFDQGIASHDRRSNASVAGTSWI